MEENKVENFIIHLRNYHTTLNTFIKLFNLWSEMSSDERGKVIDKGLMR